MNRASIRSKEVSLRSEAGRCLLLVALVWLVFGQTLTYDFVNYDDKTYVYGNAVVNTGLSAHGLVQAFTDTRTGNWHPLTIISHMLDCRFYDLRAGGHHFTNVILHTAAVLLLFFVLRGTTGAVWRSAFVAALFAVHPLRVESVAWIAERKDVLSAFFFMLTILAYARYVRKPSAARYVTMSILLTCGLLSKAMLVTVPIVLLLLDYWPLKRITDSRSFGKVALEKIPLAVLSIVSAIITFLLQERSVGSIAQLPFSWRIQNAIVSYVVYIWQTFWPVRLAVFYPHPENRLPLGYVVTSAALLLAITAVVFRWRQRRPYLLVGWLWYLVMLLPVIGIVEVGLQGHADRYTYLPHIGLFLGATWLINDARIALKVPRTVLLTAATVVIVALAAVSWKQTASWRNSETLWTHTLAVTTDNDVAHTNFGMFLVERGQLDEALTHFETALQIRSSTAHAHYALTLALIQSAIGDVFARKDQLDEAIPHLRQAVELQPDYANGHYNLGTALFQKGLLDAAIEEWQKALAIQPDDAGAHTNLGNAFLQKAALREAIGHYERALLIAPDSTLALNNLGWVLATAPDPSVRNGARAIELAHKANELSGNANAVFARTLAAAYAETGHFPEAIEIAQRASQIAADEGKPTLAKRISEDADRYRSALPLRDQSLTNGQNNP
jgi:protein O-mannosyl-transferase